MKKAFSLIELLVTLAIIGIVAAIIMNAYSGIQNSAIAVAQQKDQAELNQVLAELRMSGGNLAAIIAADTTLTTPASAGQLGTEAAELTAFLQNPVTSASKTQKGTMGGQALPINDCIIPFPYATNLMADTRNRIIFSSGTPTISGAAGQYGFVVVNVNSSEYSTFMQSNSSAVTHWILSWSTLPANNVAGVLASSCQQAATSAQTSNANGTKYAGQEAYVWDVDSTLQPAPLSGGGAGGGPIYNVAYAYAFSPSGSYSVNGGAKTGTLLPSGTYNFADYTGQTISSTQVDNFGNPATTTYYPGGTGATIYIYAYLTKDGEAVTSADTVGAADATTIRLSSFTAVGDSTDNLPATAYLACSNGLSKASGVPAGVPAGNSFTTDVSLVPGVLYIVPVCQYSAASGLVSGILPQNWEVGSSSLTITAQASSGDNSNIDASSPAMPSIKASPMIPLDAPGFTIINKATGQPVIGGDLTSVTDATITINDINGANPVAGTASDDTFATYTATGFDSGDGFTNDGGTYDFTNPDPPVGP